jgi:DNA-binding MarR family transcriptional regulator
MLIWQEPRNSQLVDGLEAAIRQLPNVSVHSRQSAGPDKSPKVDAVFEIDAGGKRTTLLIEAKNSLFPRDVRESIWQIRNYASSLPLSSRARQAVLVLAARSISSGAKDLLRSEGVGYYDEGGSLYLPGDAFYVLLDKPPSKAAVKTGRAPFSGKRSQVVHALLRQPNHWLGVRELAQKASVSPATTSQALTELEKYDWLSSRGKGPHKERKLTEPGGLLDAWVIQSRALPRPLVRRFYVASLKPEEILTRIDALSSAGNTPYAITNEWAAQLYSPFLSNIPQVRCCLPSEETTREITSQLNARLVQEGSNLGIIESKSYGDFLFRERKQDVWLASPILVYLDLIQGDGRAREMADHLRRERIGF